MPAVGLAAGGAQVEAAAQIARGLLRAGLVHAAAPLEDATEAAEEIVASMERAYRVISIGLGLPADLPRGPLSDEQMHELARDEQHIDEIAEAA